MVKEYSDTKIPTYESFLNGAKSDPHLGQWFKLQGN